MSFGEQYNRLKARLTRTTEDARKVEFERAQLYIAVFGSVAGRKVLEHMLADLHFFDEAVGEEERILRNYARRLLAIMGIWRPINAEEITSGLMNINWRKPFTSEDEQ